MFNLRLCNAAIIRYSQWKFWHLHLCGMDYKYFSPHCCKCNSLGCAAAIRCGNACHGPYSDSLYSGSEHSQFNSPRLVKREAGFPNPRRALIGSNQLWRVNDSPYYREFRAWGISVIPLPDGPEQVNSLWPSDTIWRHRSGSTLAQVMACCLTAPSHYLNQCWLIISKVLWHSLEGIIMRRSEDTN